MNKQFNGVHCRRRLTCLMLLFMLLGSVGHSAKLKDFVTPLWSNDSCFNGMTVTKVDQEMREL